MSLERVCSDGVVRLRTAMESQLHTGITSGDLWDKTVSFFAIKKVPLFPSGYTKHSREALRLFPSVAEEDVVPLLLPVRMGEVNLGFI